MEPYTSKILHLYPGDAVYILNGLQNILTEKLCDYPNFLQINAHTLT